MASTPSIERAILAGGRFWGMQRLFRRFPNVLHTRVGYTGGDVPHATYRNLGSHAEAIELMFDPRRLRYRRLLEFFFQIHDPSTPNRQGIDIGSRYRSAIFFISEEQQKTASGTIAEVDASRLWPGPAVTQIFSPGEFWEAEPEHQSYLDRHPGAYKCQFIRPNWILPVRRSG
jgi:peptide-methionine (S)-S-oxide reductase